jgi:dipeptidyl aminopeptidase/acylaminoacyl peptidase
MSAENLPLIEKIFGSPAFSRAQISPDGAKIAYLTPWQGRLNIFVAPVALSQVQKEKAYRLTSDNVRNIDGFCWTLDSRYILFVQDSKGDENWHLHRVEAKCDNPRSVDLTPIAGVRVMGLELSLARPGKAFVQMNARTPEMIDLYEIDIDTGHFTMLATNPGRYVRWVIMPEGTLHALVINERGDHELARYEEGNFIPVTVFKGQDYPFGPMPVLPSPDGRSIIIGSNRGTDRTHLARIELSTGEETEIDSHPFFSLDTPRPEADPRFPSSLIVNSVTGALLGARYLGERQVIRSLDPHFASVLEGLQRLSAAALGHISCDESGQNWVVEFTDDRHPGTTWSYNHLTGQASVLGQRYPEIDSKQLSVVRPVTVLSRDGLQLPCHVTVPLGVAARSLPTVLLVHGGPWYRDACVYDPEVQFLASRGYVVLQVNFRGSTGYGKFFMQAAIGEFAGRMHDDLIDCLDWLIGEDVADPARVAIYGCSYGGYAALVGASFTPDRFAAAISYSGMSDLRSLVEGAVSFIRPTLINNYLAYMGNPEIAEQNSDMLARSPVSRLDQIRNPLLVIHGANDVRVSRQQAEAVVEAVRSNGVEVEYLLNEQEGHWFINEDSNFELYHTIERFLGCHLHRNGRGGDAQQRDS